VLRSINGEPTSVALDRIASLSRAIVFQAEELAAYRRVLGEMGLDELVRSRAPRSASSNGVARCARRRAMTRRSLRRVQAAQKAEASRLKVHVWIHERLPPVSDPFDYSARRHEPLRKIAPSEDAP
jgi:hypothetical protein